MKYLTKSVAILLIALSMSAKAMIIPTYTPGSDFFGINKVFDYADRKIDEAIKNLDTKGSFYNNDLMKYYDVKSNEYVVMVNTNGYTKKDLNVSIEKEFVTISGKASGESPSSHGYSSAYGSFSYTITIPDDADSENVTSVYKNKMLYVKFPKSNKKPTRKQIKISTPNQ